MALRLALDAFQCRRLHRDFQREVRLAVDALLAELAHSANLASTDLSEALAAHLHLVDTVDLTALGPPETSVARERARLDGIRALVKALSFRETNGLLSNEDLLASFVEEHGYSRPPMEVFAAARCAVVLALRAQATAGRNLPIQASHAHRAIALWNDAERAFKKRQSSVSALRLSERTPRDLWVLHRACMAASTALTALFGFLLAPANIALSLVCGLLILPLAYTAALGGARSHHSKRHRTACAARDPECATTEVHRQTALCIPVLVRSTDQLNLLREKVLDHRLALGQRDTRIVILADFGDSLTAKSVDDDALFSALRALAVILAGRDQNTCVLFRERTYSSSQQCWMGRDRKRGKLSELAKLVAGQPSELEVLAGSVQMLGEIERVLVVDEDTKLATDTLGELLRVAMPEENRPVTLNGKLLRGHALIAPSIQTLHATTSSRLMRALHRQCLAKPEQPSRQLVSTPLGSVVRSHQRNFEVESAPVSQRDMFFDHGLGAGYYGKGLYWLQAFEELTSDLPNESLLSHDIVEGGHLKALFCPAATVQEVEPVTWFAWARRHHRWVRGDCQNGIALLVGLVSKHPRALPDQPLDTWLRVASQCLAHCSRVAWIGLAVISWVLQGLWPVLWGALTWAMVHVLRQARHVFLLQCPKSWSRLTPSGARWRTSSRKALCAFVAEGVVLVPRAAVELHAIAMATLAMITGRKLLSWTTVDQSDRSRPNQNPIATSTVINS